jgi:hypothetical protein
LALAVSTLAEMLFAIDAACRFIRAGMVAKELVLSARKEDPAAAPLAAAPDQRCVAPTLVNVVQGKP